MIDRDKQRYTYVYVYVMFVYFIILIQFWLIEVFLDFRIFKYPFITRLIYDYL